MGLKLRDNRTTEQQEQEYQAVMAKLAKLSKTQRQKVLSKCTVGEQVNIEEALNGVDNHR